MEATHDRRRNVCITLAICLVFSLCMPAAANSMQMHWEGVDAAGIVVSGEDCPLEVEKENLVFDVPAFPDPDDAGTVDAAHVQAQYTFSNPTDNTITATLLFPFGMLPSYARTSTDESWDLSADIQGYDITVDGKPVDRIVRYTFYSLGASFDAGQALNSLHDSYASDVFYAPDTPVTRYLYVPEGVDTEAHSAASAALKVSLNPSKTKVLLENQSGFDANDSGVELSAWVDPEQTYVLDIIGESLSEPPQWGVYDDGSHEVAIDGVMELVGIETVTVEDLFLDRYKPALGVSEADWYNATLELMRQSEVQGGVIDVGGAGVDLLGCLMRWYQYELTVKPHLQVTNTVQAPMYPALFEEYEPPVYQYTYLLSPARRWAAFGHLDISIHTPFYLTDSNIECFEGNEAGYVLQMGGLPDADLVFTLSSSANPQSPQDRTRSWLIGIAVCATGACAVGYLFARRRKKREAECSTVS